MTAKKVTFAYDDATGLISDSNGLIVSCIGMIPFESEQQTSSAVDEIIRLKAAGFSAEEIIGLRSAIN